MTKKKQNRSNRRRQRMDSDRLKRQIEEVENEEEGDYLLDTAQMLSLLNRSPSLAEPDLRIRYEEYTGVDPERSLEIGAFCECEQLRKYALEMSFWASRWLFTMQMFDSPYYVETQRLMLHKERAAMIYMCNFYKDDYNMLIDIMNLTNKIYQKRYKSRISPHTLALFNCVNKGKQGCVYG